MRAGQLFEISNGNRHAVVTEEGATLAQVVWEGVDLLVQAAEDGYAGEPSNGQVLAPWPGRVAGGSYEFEGQRQQLPINDLFRRSAIHGFARWLAWQPKDHGPDRLTLACRHLARPGYPFPLELEQSYAWLNEGLEICLTATNIGRGTAPFGCGYHPYFTLGSPTVDDDLLHVPANLYLETDQDLRPTGPKLPVDGTAWDFRQLRPVGPGQIDITLTDAVRDDEGRIVVTFASGAGDMTVKSAYDEPIEFIQVYTGDNLPTGSRQGLAIEPYTCAPDAFNNGFGLAHLEPGGSLRVRWVLSADSSTGRT